MDDDDDNDDDDEGMEVQLGFSPKAVLWSESALAGPSGSADVPTQGSTASLSKAGVVLAEPGPVVAEEAVVTKEITTDLP